MKIYRISFDKLINGVGVFDGDTGFPSDSGIWWEAVRMKDGTIYYGYSHYEIVHHFSLAQKERRTQIESFGLVGADGSYTVKSKDTEGYLKGKYSYDGGWEKD